MSQIRYAMKKRRSICFFYNKWLFNYYRNCDQIRKYSSKVSYQITLDGDENEHDKVRFVSKNKGSYREIVNNIKLLLKIII